MATPEGRQPGTSRTGTRGEPMIFQFSFDWAIQGVVVAPDIEGAAEIEFGRDGGWRVPGIELLEFNSDRSVIIPDDHPICRDIKLWLLKNKVDEIDEAVGAELPRNDPHAEHRHSVRELV